MTKGTVPVNLHILDSEYLVSSPPGEVEGLQAAARYLNEKMIEIRDGGRVIGLQRIAVMAALNLSYELLKTRREAEDVGEFTEERLQALLQQVETALRKTGATAV